MSVWPRVIASCYSLLFMAVPLVWLAQTSELFEFNKILVTYLLTIVIGGAWIARMIAEKRVIFRRTPLDLPLIVFLAVQLLSLLFSLDPHISWYGYYSRWNGGLLSLLTYTLLYWAAVSNLDRSAVRLCLKSALATAVVVAVYAAWEHLGHSPSCLLTRGSWGVDCWVQDVQTRVFATLGQPNWLAAYLVALIFLPLPGSGLFRPESSQRRSRLIQLLIFILLFAALLFTKSRSGLLAFGGAAAVYAALIGPGLNSQAKKLLGVYPAVMLLLMVVIPNPIRDVVIKSSAPAPTGPALEVGGTESGNIRKIVWTGAGRIWTGSVKNFLIGTGPETFALAYYQFRPVEHNLTSEWELLYNKAHNEFLNYLATTGILGLTSYLILLGAMFKTLLAKLKTQWVSPELLAGWVSLPITNFWGFSVVVTQLFLWLFPALVLVATAPDLPPARTANPSGGGKLAALAMATIAIWLIFLTGRYFLADVKYAAGTSALKSFQATFEPAYLLSAYQLFTAAFAHNPAEPAISSELSVAAAYLANSLREADATTSGQLSQIAVAASDKAIATSPHHPNYYKARARTMILLSDLDPQYLSSAAAALEKAAEISPTDPRIPHNLGVVYSTLGATPSARAQFEKALRLKPDFAEAQAQLEQISSSSK